MRSAVPGTARRCWEPPRGGSRPGWWWSTRFRRRRRAGERQRWPRRRREGVSSSEGYDRPVHLRTAGWGPRIRGQEPWVRSAAYGVVSPRFGGGRGGSTQRQTSLHFAAYGTG